MDEALRRVKLMRADLGGTEILTPLRNIYSGPSIPGHPLQVKTETELTEGDRENEISVQESIVLGFTIGLMKYDLSIT